MIFPIIMGVYSSSKKCSSFLAPVPEMRRNEAKCSGGFKRFMASLKVSWEVLGKTSQGY